MPWPPSWTPWSPRAVSVWKCDTRAMSDRDRSFGGSAAAILLLIGIAGLTQLARQSGRYARLANMALIIVACGFVLLFLAPSSGGVLQRRLSRDAVLCDPRFIGCHSRLCAHRCLHSSLPSTAPMAKRSSSLAASPFWPPMSRPPRSCWPFLLDWRWLRRDSLCGNVEQPRGPRPLVGGPNVPHHPTPRSRSAAPRSLSPSWQSLATSMVAAARASATSPRWMATSRGASMPREPTESHVV